MSKPLPITKAQRAAIKYRARKEGEQRMIRAFRAAMARYALDRALIHNIVCDAIGDRS